MAYIEIIVIIGTVCVILVTAVLLLRRMVSEIIIN
jgi:hypothetical protein